MRSSASRNHHDRVSSPAPSPSVVQALLAPRVTITGEPIPEDGCYCFVGYVDGSTHPRPLRSEAIVALSKGSPTPGVRSSGKMARFRLYQTSAPIHGTSGA